MKKGIGLDFLVMNFLEETFLSDGLNCRTSRHIRMIRDRKYSLCHPGDKQARMDEWVLLSEGGGNPTNLSRVGW